ncbi:hypothetical protein ZWY2020_005059 [Hordeum vulgare]|nr:hypothetical protein ZWY2020_005059 [Hordeum vulgare]
MTSFGKRSSQTWWKWRSGWQLPVCTLRKVSARTRSTVTCGRPRTLQNRWYGGRSRRTSSQHNLVVLRDHVVILQEYDGFKNSDTMKLDKLAVAQIHWLSNKFLIEPVVKLLASRIGEVEEVQLKLRAGFFGEFVRVKVLIDINAKIKRFVTAKKGDERVQYQVKYEKLPTFCYNCGEFGHWHE